MQKIMFPGLNLEFEVSKVAFTIGSIQIYWYAILIVVALILALIFLKKDDGKYNISFENHILELSIFLIPISIITARIYYCIFNLEYYIANPIKILDFRSGGLAIYGGIIGGLITAITYCKIKKINLLDLLDYIVPYLALGQAIGRWGNFINVEAYGRKTNLPWRMAIVEKGEYIEVHPTFLYESIATFFIFIILMVLKNKRKFKGEITYIYLIMYTFVRSFIETLRTDSLMFLNLRISQLISVLIFIIVVILLSIKTIDFIKSDYYNRRIRKE